MPIGGNSETVSQSNSVAVVVFPWKTAYPPNFDDDKYSKTRETTEEPKIIGLGGKHSGITYLSISKRKEVGGSLVLDLTGPIDSDLTVVGTWCAVITSSKTDLLKVLASTGGKTATEKIQKVISSGVGVVRFIGQIFQVHTTHVATAEGTLRRICKISVRDWAFCWQCPVFFHPGNWAYMVTQTKEGGINPATARKLIEDLNADHGANSASKDHISELVRSVFNVFHRPHLIAAFFQAATENAVKSAKINETIKVTQATQASWGRLPTLPRTMIDSLMGHVQKVSENAAGQRLWGAIFFSIMSGVQDWKGPTSPKFKKDGVLDLRSSGRISDYLRDHDQSDKWVMTSSERNKRPISFFNIAPLYEGRSAHELLASSVANVGGVEVYTELIPVKSTSQATSLESAYSVSPTLVCRDIPFSLKKFPPADASVKWTFYDDLPYVEIKSASVQSIDVKSTFQNSTNLLRLTPSNVSALSDLIKNSVLMNSLMIIPTSQERFGTVMRDYPTSDMLPWENYSGELEGVSQKRTLDATKRKSAKGDVSQEEIEKINEELAPSKIAAAVTSEKDFKEEEYKDDKGNKKKRKIYVGTTYFSALKERVQAWYGEEYKFPSGVLKIKDYDYRFAVGNNIRFRFNSTIEYAAHVVGYDLRYSVREGGVLESTVFLYYERLCYIDKNGYFNPLPHPNCFSRLPVLTMSEVETKYTVGSPLPEMDISNFSKAETPAVSSIDTSGGSVSDVSQPNLLKSRVIVESASSAANATALEAIKNVVADSGAPASHSKDIEEHYASATDYTNGVTGGDSTL